jgi:hypothetical protein
MAKEISLNIVDIIYDTYNALQTCMPKKTIVDDITKDSSWTLKKLQFKFHPDKCKNKCGEPLCTQVFQTVQQLLESTDPTRRHSPDRSHDRSFRRTPPNFAPYKKILEEFFNNTVEYTINEHHRKIINICILKETHGDDVDVTREIDIICNLIYAFNSKPMYVFIKVLLNFSTKGRDIRYAVLDIFMSILLELIKNTSGGYGDFNKVFRSYTSKKSPTMLFDTYAYSAYYTDNDSIFKSLILNTRELFPRHTDDDFSVCGHYLNVSVTLILLNKFLYNNSDGECSILDEEDQPDVDDFINYVKFVRKHGIYHVSREKPMTWYSKK